MSWARSECRLLTKTYSLMSRDVVSKPSPRALQRLLAERQFLEIHLPDKIKTDRTTAQPVHLCKLSHAQARTGTLILSA